MLYVQGTDIKITRGDNAQLGVYIECECGCVYPLRDSDELKLTAIKGAKLDKPVIEISADKDGIFHFAPETTKHLLCGIYRYDIQLTTKDKEIYTIIPVSNLQISEEVS